MPTSTVSYEVVAILRGSLKPTLAKEALATVKKEVEQFGKIQNSVTWEARPLAYKIAKESTGTYAIFQVAGNPTKAAEMERFLRLDGAVIRHLITKTPKDYVWREYSAEDLEGDYEQALRKNLWSEDEKSSNKRTPAKKPAVRRPAKSAADVNKKFDEIENA